MADDSTPPDMPNVDPVDLPDDVVLSIQAPLHFGGGDEDHVELPHSDGLALTNGTIAVSFQADDVTGRHALFSKDARDFGTGGHLTAFVEDGRIKVRLQSETESYYVWSEPMLVTGETYDLAVTFGLDGLRIDLNGETVGWNREATDGIELNTESLVIGANTWARDEHCPSWTGDEFEGTILEFTVYQVALSPADVAAMMTPSLPTVE